MKQILFAAALMLSVGAHAAPVEAGQLFPAIHAGQNASITYALGVIDGTRGILHCATASEDATVQMVVAMGAHFHDAQWAPGISGAAVIVEAMKRIAPCTAMGS